MPRDTYLKGEVGSAGLPSVPPPPKSAAKVKRGVVPKPNPAPEVLTEEYLESEFKKLDFFIQSGLIKEANESLINLKKQMVGASRELRQRFKWDLKRIETALELLGL